jgi:hypothetical protein
MHDREVTGFQKISSLTEQVSGSPGSSVSIPGPRPMPSEITGSRKTGPGPISAIGRPRTGPGFAIALSEPVLAAIAAADPEAVDEAILAGLKPLVGSSLAQTRRDWDDPTYGFMSEFTGWTFGGAGPREAAEALALVETAMRPATRREIQMAMAELRASTIARNHQLAEQTLVFQVIASECGEWPADIVKAALIGWAKRERFWPVRAEVRAELQRHGRRRRALLDALRNPTGKPAPAPRELTRDDRRDAERLAAELLAKFGQDAPSADQILRAEASWSTFGSCTWWRWTFALREHQRWAVALARRLGELVEAGGDRPAIHAMVESAFAEALAE